MKKIVVYLWAMLAGFVNGVIGTGGGAVVMPALYKNLKDSKMAHQAVCVFVLPLAVLSASSMRSEIGVHNIILVLLGGFLGGIGGALISRKISFRKMKILFAVIILYMGLSLIL